jgi:small subunit ribosomal protein S4
VAYCILESSLQLFSVGDRMKGVTWRKPCPYERRFDNVAYRLGFATSRSESVNLFVMVILTINGRK